MLSSSLGGEHIVHTGVAGILSLRHGTCNVDVEVAGNLEGHTQFCSIVILLQSGETHVSEAVHIIEIEVLPVGTVICVCIVTCQVEASPTAVEGITQFGTEDFLLLEIGNKVVVHLWALKCHAGTRSTGFIAYTHADGVTLAQVERAAHLESAIQEMSLSTLAVRGILGPSLGRVIESVEHMSVSPHLSGSHLDREIVVTDALVLDKRSPSLGILADDIIIIAHLVTLSHHAIGIVEVILYLTIVGGISALCIGVHIVEIRSTQEVFHGGIMITLVVGQLQSHLELGAIVDRPVEGRAQAVGQVVVVLGLYPIDCIMTGGIELLIGEIQFVEVNLAVTDAGHPVVTALLPCSILVSCSGIAPHVIVIGREVLPVIGSRVLPIIVQACGTVFGILGKGAGGEFHSLIDLIIPGQQHTGLVIVHHAAGTLLTILIAPIGVVLAVVGQPVSLIGAGSLLCTFCGIAPGGQIQRMILIDDLLCREEITQAVVESTVHGSRIHIGPAISHGTEEGPPFLGESGSIGIHGTECIVTIQSRESHLIARSIVACTEVIVAASTYAGHTESIHLEGCGGILITGSIVHTAYGGIVELPVLQVVDLHSIHIDITIL